MDCNRYSNAWITQFIVSSVTLLIHRNLYLVYKIIALVFYYTQLHAIQLAVAVKLA
jgi:hypothetical protein